MANSLKVVVDLDLLESMMNLIATSLNSIVCDWEVLPYRSIPSDLQDELTETQFLKLQELANTLQR